MSMLPTDNGSAHTPTNAQGPTEMHLPPPSRSGPPPQRAAATTAESASVELLRRETSDVWNVPFDRVTLEQSIDRIGLLIDAGVPSYVITANLNYVMLHDQQRDLVQVTGDAAMILADGQPIVWRSRLGIDPLPERV